MGRGRKTVMSNPLTAERAREIARDSLKRATGFPVELMHPVVINSIAADFIDQHIETLEACAKQRCFCFEEGYRTYEDGYGIYRHERKGIRETCHAQYEQRELIRLKRELEKLC